MSKKPIPEHQLYRINQIRLFVRNFRLNESCTIAEFSKLSATHPNTIQRFETTNKNTTILTLFNFVDAMNMTLAEFFENIERI
jgi:transcriptional regulator with XRE-family HTH domain